MKKTVLIPFGNKRVYARIRALMLALLVFGATLLCGCRFSLNPAELFSRGKPSATASETPAPQSQSETGTTDSAATRDTAVQEVWFTLNGEDIPVFDGNTASISICQNIPSFTEEMYALAPCESYSALDELGRTQSAMACLSAELMPTEERGNVDYPDPTGYNNRRYIFIEDGQYVYNHCHLIGYQLTGQTDKLENLITGTRYFNVTGMLPYENQIADYLRDTKNRVLYRVTPVYVGDELVARGVVMEAYSVEDSGLGISFHVFCYNVQPGVVIDYATGKTESDGTL